jgi:type IV pilus assembly protein PilW
MSRRDTNNRAQLGFTLAELLIGMTLSLLIIAAASTAYGTSKQTWNAMVAVDSVYANARIALRNIHEQSLMAGAAYLKATSNTDGRFSVDVSTSEDLGQAALAGVKSSTYSESLTLSHWHALDVTDCQGNVSSTQSTVRNSYKLNTNKELTCKDLNLNNSTYQALAEGLEDFQVRYAETNPMAQTVQWKTANQVSAMSQVIGLEVCVVVASISNANQTKSSISNTGCQGQALASDGRVRRTFKRVTALRNREDVMP